MSDSSKHKSGITLGDLLDLFDGICEMNGIVYIITTNHLEYLDPAITRSGRINLRIEMNKMNTIEIKDMLSYYYVKNNKVTDMQIKNNMIETIEAIARKLDGKIKPSELEEKCFSLTLLELFENIESLDTLIK